MKLKVELNLMMNRYLIKIILMNIGLKQQPSGNYSIKLRKKLGSDIIEEVWNGDKEKEKLKVKYFGIGDLPVQ